ncbi:membrane protein [Azorhizobium oxalatiphilum]|uniref:Membrane protein n=1 Tax=Azorhizobium oxalatiphilum TaxID=980631 RepID=A0A917FEG9_9HYPH|nr:DUF4142 domain-containing protein [Azorhizobium oxalatiphilum]GGF73528.1 membrane protein [Azorhizobium oxalatiphilum]
MKTFLNANARAAPAFIFAAILSFAVTFAMLWSPPTATAQLTGTLSGPRFVETAGVAGLFEIESSKLALERSKSPEIQKFAQEMVDDHTKIAADLKRAATSANGDVPVPSALDAEHEAMIRKLKAATGTDFDTLYVAMQTTAHEEAVGLFGAFAKDGDQTALKSFAADTLPILQKHLEHVRMIQLKT